VAYLGGAGAKTSIGGVYFILVYRGIPPIAGMAATMRLLTCLISAIFGVAGHFWGVSNLVKCHPNANGTTLEAYHDIDNFRQ